MGPPETTGRKVATCRTHHERGCGLVAAAEENDAVDGIAANGFLDVHADKVPKEHGGRTNDGLTEGHDRKFKRETTGFPYAAFHVFGNVAQVSVAGSKFRPGIANPDDGPAVEYVFRNPWFFIQLR